LLESAEDHNGADWNFLRAEVYAAQRQFREAAACYHKAEETYPAKTTIRLERCYRELQDYQRAYFYACKHREL
jgi:tetratricopeptide (TPR) repeat protein